MEESNNNILKMAEAVKPEECRWRIQWTRCFLFYFCALRYALPQQMVSILCILLVSQFQCELSKQASKQTKQTRRESSRTAGLRSSNKILNCEITTNVLVTNLILALIWRLWDQISVFPFKLCMIITIYISLLLVGYNFNPGPIPFRVFLSMGMSRYRRVCCIQSGMFPSPTCLPGFI